MRSVILEYKKFVNNQIRTYHEISVVIELAFEIQLVTIFEIQMNEIRMNQIQPATACYRFSTIFTHVIRSLLNL